MTSTQPQANTQTRGLSVNAAFLKDIKDDNRDLKNLFDKLQPLAEHQQTAINHWPELIQLCSALRDQLALHFSQEEAYGYFDDAIDAAPQLSLNAESLRRQHTELFQTICELSEQVFEVSQESEESVAGFLKSLIGFQSAFQEHEEAELKLILDAMDSDIGVGD